MEGPTKRKVKIGCLVLALLGIGLGVWFYGPLVRALYSKGFFDQYLHGDDTKKYEGTSAENLKYIRTALMGYESSEGQFPLAAGWMDAIRNRLNTDDLKKGESAKKLVYPGFVGQEGRYGYAFNEALGGKYHGDIKDPKTPMVFEATQTERNAHGDPAKIRRTNGLAITIGGEIVH